jgi:hypothetical protein
MPPATRIPGARECDEMEPHAVPSLRIPLLYGVVFPARLTAGRRAVEARLSPGCSLGWWSR